MGHRTCPDCGASLDPCEICDCKENEGAPAGTGTPSGGNDCGRDSIFSLSNPYWDVNNLLRLKEVREGTGVLAKDVAAVVQNRFPKFNRQLLSQAEAFEKYGVIIHPDGLRAICVAYGILLTDPKVQVEEDPKPIKKKPAHRKLGRKLTFRMTNGDYEVLQKAVERDGFESVQAWLYAKITALLGGTENAETS